MWFKEKAPEDSIRVQVGICVYSKLYLILVFKKNVGLEMVQQLKARVALVEDLGLISSTHAFNHGSQQFTT